MPRSSNEILFHPSQNYSCMSCGKCCRIWDVPITKSEKERIESLKIPDLPKEIGKCFRADGRRRIFLIEKHREKCVFLDEENLCRIHRLHGEPAKPLACRLYPFDVFNWKDGKVSASFRFDCPAVAHFKGQKMSSHMDAVRAFARELSKSGALADAVYCDGVAPGIHRLRIIASAYQKFLTDSALKPAVRVCAAARLVEFHSGKENQFEIKEASSSFIENALKLVRRSADDLASDILGAEDLNVRQRILFRYIVSGFLRSDEEAASASFLGGRISRADKILRFCLGKGVPRKICRDFPVDSETDALGALAKAKLSEDALVPYWDYISSKLASLHFCGYPAKQLTFEEGMRQLLISFPVVVSLASIIAAGKGGSTIQGADVSDAIVFVDHTFSRSPFFTLSHVRRIIRELTGRNLFAAILKLIPD